jgi:hypothetical protein
MALILASEPSVGVAVVAANTLLTFIVTTQEHNIMNVIVLFIKNIKNIDKKGDL